MVLGPMIREKVTLTTGEEVWAYRLNKDEADFIKKLWGQGSDLLWFLSRFKEVMLTVPRLERVNDRVDLLELANCERMTLTEVYTMLMREVIQHYSKSFRRGDITGQIPTYRDHHNMIDKILDGLIEDGTIIKSRGWLKRANHRGQP
jgi:hypothetical protein